MNDDVAFYWSVISANWETSKADSLLDFIINTGSLFVDFRKLEDLLRNTRREIKMHREVKRTKKTFTW